MDDSTSIKLDAIHLLFSGDAELWAIIGVSFQVSRTAIFISVPPALVIAFILAYADFPGRRLRISISITLLAVPAVVIGLAFVLLLSHQGHIGA